MLLLFPCLLSLQLLSPLLQLLGEGGCLLLLLLLLLLVLCTFPLHLPLLLLPPRQPLPLLPVLLLLPHMLCLPHPLLQRS